MNKSLPTWALKVATPEDYDIVRDAHHLGKMRIQWTDSATIRKWAKQQGWSTPWFEFEEKFIAKMLENKEHFKQVINESGIKIYIPRQTYTLSVEEIRRLDALYEARADMGGILGQRPTCWDSLVEELREIRRAIEAGVVVNIEGSVDILNSWQSFYAWAHGRYHMLEDGCDHWIGDDDS